METNVQIAYWLLVSLCSWSCLRHHTNLCTHWTSCTSNWFVFSCRCWNGQHSVL